MKEFNLYLNFWDFSELAQLFREKGSVYSFKRKEYFVRQQGRSLYAGWIAKGVFEYSKIADDGKIHTVGFAFADEFVCDYLSLVNKSLSVVNIQAMTDCTVYLIPRQELIAYLDANMVTQYFGRKIAESLYEMVYSRLLEAYCDTPEDSYRKLMNRCPDLKEQVSLRKIASFLRVTPETISHIRKKILTEEKVLK